MKRSCTLFGTVPAICTTEVKVNVPEEISKKELERNLKARGKQATWEIEIQDATVSGGEVEYYSYEEH